MSVIVVPPSLDWTWMKQRPQHIMTQLAAAGHTVFYCDLTRSSETVVQEIAPGLFRVRRHEEWLRSEWPNFRRRLAQPVIVWCSVPRSPASLHRDYDPDFLVYDCADDCPEWYPLERELASAANLIVCSSERLWNRLRRSYPGKDLLLVRNGYDPAMGLHLPAREPQDGQTSLGETRRIGYVGAWAPWIDEALVRELSRKLDAEVSVIGPAFGRKLGTASANERIRYLGLKNHDELADWIRGFAVCLIPFRQTPIALAANPIKAYEYLAAGKPVISTDLPECRLMRPYVDVAANRNAFLREAARRLEDPGDEASRRQFALNNTWRHRGAVIDAWIQENRWA